MGEGEGEGEIERAEEWMEREGGGSCVTERTHRYDENAKIVGERNIQRGRNGILLETKEFGVLE